MVSDDQLSRRSSNAATTPSSAAASVPPQSIPTYKNVWNRLIYGPRLSTSQPTPPDNPNSRRPSLQLIGPELSQTTSYPAGADIVAFDLSENKSHVILAGKFIFKIIRVDGKHCVEEHDLRKAILDYGRLGASSTSHITPQRQILDIHDVKWSHGLYSNYVATASVNGKVVLYDLNRPGVEVTRLDEHTRQVHKVAFNPYQGFLLLSGCHSGTVKLWDIRQAQQEAINIRSRCTINGKSEAVRALQWSPKDGVEFAIGTDQGAVQRWDYRFPKTPKLKIQAHSRNCTSIDWHPDGKHLVSASDDQTIKVWDFSSGDKRQDPVAALRTPFSVHNVRWRPPCLSSGKEKIGEWQCTQIATSYDENHSVVHVWDFRRPCVPFRELNYYGQAPTGMHWRDQHLLWTVGREGLFIQSDVHFAPKTMDRRPMSVLAVAPDGAFTFFSKRRLQRLGFQRQFRTSDQSSSDSTGRGISPELLFPAKSSAEDSLDESFLRLSLKERRSRTSSGRSSKSLGNTPPSSEETKRVVLFDKTMSAAKSLKFKQLAIRHLTPLAEQAEIHRYLAQKYRVLATDDASSVDAVAIAKAVCYERAMHAEQTSLYGLAKTWRWIALAIEEFLARRAEEQTKNQQKDKDSEPSQTSTLPNTQSTNLFSIVALGGIKALVNYHSQIADVQTATFIILDLAPLLQPPLLPGPPPAKRSKENDRILNIFARTLIEEKEIAPAVVDRVTITHQHLFDLGISPLHADAILSSYHHYLIATQLHKEAADLRKRCHPKFPGVWSEGVSGADTEPKRDDKPPRCPICRLIVSPYSFGGTRELSGSFKITSEAGSSNVEHDESGVYSVCAGCGHGGHLACLVRWHKDSNLGCPTEGCVHQCQQDGGVEIESGKGKEPAGGKRVRWE